MPLKTRRRTYKGGFTQYLGQLQGLAGKLGGLKGLTSKLGGLKGLTSKLGGLKGLTSKFGGLKGIQNKIKSSITPEMAEQFESQFGQQEPSAPPMNMSPQQAQVVAPPMAQYATPPMAQIVPPPMAQIVPPPNQNVFAKLKQKYPNLKRYVRASNGQYYPEENYVKYPPVELKGGKKTRRRRRRN